MLLGREGLWKATRRQAPQRQSRALATPWSTHYIHDTISFCHLRRGRCLHTLQRCLQWCGRWTTEARHHACSLAPSCGQFRSLSKGCGDRKRSPGTWHHRWPHLISPWGGFTNTETEGERLIQRKANLAQSYHASKHQSQQHSNPDLSWLQSSQTFPNTALQVEIDSGLPTYLGIRLYHDSIIWFYVESQIMKICPYPLEKSLCGRSLGSRVGMEPVIQMHRDNILDSQDKPFNQFLSHLPIHTLESHLFHASIIHLEIRIKWSEAYKLKSGYSQGGKQDRVWREVLLFILLVSVSLETSIFYIYFCRVEQFYFHKFKNHLKLF